MAKAKKRPSRSISSLVGKRDIDPAAIDKAAAKIHKSVKPVELVEKKKAIKVSVSTPHSLYHRAQKARLSGGFSSLKDFYLYCVEQHLTTLKE